MGQPELSQIMSWLRGAGYRVDRGFPGTRMPRIQWPAIAVSLHHQNSAEGTRTVSVVVCCPTEQGGSTCEDMANRVAILLTTYGASCIQEACKYDNWGNFFSVQILATWSPGAFPNFTVKLGTTTAEYATAFTAEQEILRTPIGAMGQTDSDRTVTSTGAWQLTLVEEFPKALHGISTVSEPFSVTVTRGQGTEVFRNCYWLGTRREDTVSGLRQTRRAVAAERSVSTA